MSETVWVVARWISSNDEGACWDLQGVFTDEDKALEACRVSFPYAKTRLTEADIAAACA